MRKFICNTQKKLYTICENLSKGLTPVGYVILFSFFGHGHLTLGRCSDIIPGLLLPGIHSVGRGCDELDGTLHDH
jgi:hypothetical protein